MAVRDLCLQVLDHASLIAMLALTAGMRPGEILALQWKHIRPGHIEVVQRVYHQEIDTPKTKHSVRSVPLSPSLSPAVEAWFILGLSVMTDVLFLLVAKALYQALSQFQKNAMQLAVAGMSLFVVLDLALTWTNYAVLISLSSQYAQAAGQAQKAAVVAAAQYPAVVVAGLVMRKGAFSKPTAYLGVASCQARTGRYGRNECDPANRQSDALQLSRQLLGMHALEPRP